MGRHPFLHTQFQLARQLLYDRNDRAIVGRASPNLLDRLRRIASGASLLPMEEDVRKRRRVSDLLSWVRLFALDGLHRLAFWACCRCTAPIEKERTDSGPVGAWYISARAEDGAPTRIRTCGLCIRRVQV